MSDTLYIKGSITSGESCGCGSSGGATITVPIDESLDLKGSPFMAEFELTSDSPVTVPLAALAQAHLVFMRVTGGKARARLTSADGTQQAIPVDPLLLVESQSVPFTAIDITRVSGVPVTVRVLLAEKSS